MDAAIAGLIGAGIGAVTTIAGTWLQAHYQSKRERARFLMEFASTDRQRAYEIVKEQGLKSTIPSLSVYIWYHEQLMKILESGEITEKKLHDLVTQTERITESVNELMISQASSRLAEMQEQQDRQRFDTLGHPPQ